MVDSSERHPVWFVAYPGIQPLDLVGPHEVFAGANRAAEHLGRRNRRYLTRIVSLGGGPIDGESGLAIQSEPFPDPITASGTLLLPGGDGVYDQVRENPALVGWVRTAGEHADRVATVCSGTFLAGAAGLIDHRRVATHWARAEQLALAHPTADVDGDAIWTRDGALWSSAGVTAGIDLALAIVEHDMGPEVANEVARWMVVFLRRPGGQSQFAARAWQPTSTDSTVRALQDRILSDPGADHCLDRLAEAAGWSARHLSRRFTAELGQTPARYVEHIRVEAARRHLEDGDLTMQAIAERCGFGTAETLRRAIHRHLGVAPDDYRQHFSQSDRRSKPKRTHV